MIGSENYEKFVASSKPFCGDGVSERKEI